MTVTDVTPCNPGASAVTTSCPIGTFVSVATPLAPLRATTPPAETSASATGSLFVEDRQVAVIVPYCCTPIAFGFGQPESASAAPAAATATKHRDKGDGLFMKGTPMSVVSTRLTFARDQNAPGTSALSYTARLRTPRRSVILLCT